MNTGKKIIKFIVEFYQKQRIKELERSREKWKQKAMANLKYSHELEKRLAETEKELKKTDSAFS